MSEKSKVLRGILVLLAMFLVFAGPTYVVLLIRTVGISYSPATAFGFILLLIGLTLIIWLAKKGEFK